MGHNDNMKIRWNSDNIETIADSMFLVWLERPFESVLAIYTEALKSVPEDIRRPLQSVSMTTAPDLVRAFYKRVQEFIVSKRPEPVPTEAPLPQIIEVEGKPVPVTPFQALSQIDTKYLIAELFDRLQRNATVPLPTASPVAPQSATPLPVVIKEPEPPKPKKTKIAIIGLLADQFAHVRDRVNGNAELVFLDKDKSRPVDSVPISCNYVIVLKADHSVSEVAKQKFGPDRVFFVDGGVTAVTQKCLDLASRK